MPGKHAKLSPSASKRWMQCTASPLYTTSLLDAGKIQGDNETEYSREGTEAHDWAAKVLRVKKPLSIDKVPESFRPHILEYREVCTECERGAGEDSLRMVETDVPLFYSPDENGTMDYGFVRVDKKGKLEKIFIRDLKYGKGVPVDAEENTQLAIYGFSLITDLRSWWDNIPGHIPISTAIHQPRYVDDDNLKEWELSVEELEEFCKEKEITKIVKRITKAKSVDELEFAPSAEVCQFCPAKAVCKARAATAFQGFPVDVLTLDLFDDMSPPSVESLSPETVASVWRHAGDIKKWLDNAEEFLSALAFAGTPVEGTKLVQGRDGNRAWKDEKMAEKFLLRYLKDGTYKPKAVISPTQAEKDLSKYIEKKPLATHMTKLVTRSQGKQTLAKEEDKRPAVAPATDHFDVITDDEEKV
jgi:hypothetical protein